MSKRQCTYCRGTGGFMVHIAPGHFDTMPCNVCNGTGTETLFTAENALREIATNIENLIKDYGDENYVTDTEKLVKKICEIIHKAADGMQSHFDSFHD